MSECLCRDVDCERLIHPSKTVRILNQLTCANLTHLERQHVSALELLSESISAVDEGHDGDSIDQRSRHEERAIIRIADRNSNVDDRTDVSNVTEPTHKMVGGT